MLGRKKKGSSHCDYVFGSSTKFQRRMNGFVKADICRQVSVCLHVFCGILFALPLLQFMLGLHFTPACVLLPVCSLHFTLSLHFTPGPQSAVRSLRFTLTNYRTVLVKQRDTCQLKRALFPSNTLYVMWQFQIWIICLVWLGLKRGRLCLKIWATKRAIEKLVLKWIMRMFV